MSVRILPVAVSPPVSLILIALLATLFPASVATAQERGGSASRNVVQGKAARSADARKHAMRFLRQLELADQREAAVAGLIRLGADAVPVLVDGLRDPRPEVIAHVIRVLGALGKAGEAALPRLDEYARSGDPLLVRAAALARRAIRPAGTLLVADSRGRILELAQKTGRRLRSITTAQRPWDVEPLPSGNFLITQHTPSLVMEIKPDGARVWSFDALSHPMDADRLANGNTLIADTQGNRVIEVDPTGRIVWRADKGIRPNDADRLLNGNTLCASSNLNKVTELDPKGAVVWEYDGCTRPVDADRLFNGNTLIASYAGKLVREVDPRGKTVLEIKLDSTPRDADRLANGHTIVSMDSSIAAFDPRGRKLWQFEHTGAREIVAR